MPDIYFETTERDVFPYWINEPAVGLRRVMALIALAPKMGLTGNKKPIVRDKSGQVIDGLVLDSSDSKDLVERLEKYDFSKDWKFHITIGKNQRTISKVRFPDPKVGRERCRAMRKMTQQFRTLGTKRTERY